MNRCHRVLSSGSVPRFWVARIFLVLIVLTFLHGHSANALTGSGDEPNSSDNLPKPPMSVPRGPLPSGPAAGVIPAQGTYIQDPLVWEELGVLTLLAAGVAGILVGGRTSTTVTTSGSAATSSQ